MVELDKTKYILNLKEYNQSRLHNFDIVSGKEYRRILRKNRRENCNYSGQCTYNKV